MTRLPLDFPPLVEMASRAAREWSDLWVRARAERGDMGPWLGWDHTDNADQRETETAVQFTLLSDLARPESQALWLRWLAGRLGVPVPDVGAPCWYLVPKRLARELRAVDGEYLDHDDGAPAMWVLSGDGHERTFAWWDPNDGPPPAPVDGVDVWLPSWPDAPIRALVLALLTVGAG